MYVWVKLIWIGSCFLNWVQRAVSQSPLIDHIDEVLYLSVRTNYRLTFTTTWPHCKLAAALGCVRFLRDDFPQKLVDTVDRFGLAYCIMSVITTLSKNFVLTSATSKSAEQMRWLNKNECAALLAESFGAFPPVSWLLLAVVNEFRSSNRFIGLPHFQHVSQYGAASRQTSMVAFLLWWSTIGLPDLSNNIISNDNININNARCTLVLREELNRRERSRISMDHLSSYTLYMLIEIFWRLMASSG